MNGTEFKTKRERIGWTQRDAAEALGVTIPQISAIENGRSKVTKTIEKLIGFYRLGDAPNRPTNFPEDNERPGRAW